MASCSAATLASRDATRLTAASASWRGTWGRRVHCSSLNHPGIVWDQLAVTNFKWPVDKEIAALRAPNLQEVKSSAKVSASRVVAIMTCDATCFCGACLKKVRMFCPRTQRRGRRSCPHRHRIRTGLFEPKSPLRGNGIFRAETNRPKRPWRFKDAGAETKSR
jgi:hypothetical protein